jgi:hypothetical protein
MIVVPEPWIPEGRARGDERRDESRREEAANLYSTLKHERAFRSLTRPVYIEMHCRATRGP